MPQLVFLDANVIFSRVLRDWVLMLCASTRGEIFTLATSEDVLAEAVARLRDRYPAAPSGLVENLRDKVRDYVDEMVTGYPGGEVAWIADEGDWHVHHAALHCGAQILLTQDAGFASDETPYEAQSCDQLFCRIDDAAPAAVCERSSRCRLGTGPRRAAHASFRMSSARWTAPLSPIAFSPT